MLRKPVTAVIAAAWIFWSAGVGRVEGQPSASARTAPAKPAGPQAPLTNTDVIRMVGSGLSESIVLTSVRHARQTNFDSSPDALIALRLAKVSDAVISAMLDRANTAPPVAVPVRVRTEDAGSSEPPPPPKRSSPTPAAGLPAEVGVYVVVSGRHREVDPEIVNWRTGGFLKRMATAGLVGGHVNGWIANPRSKLQLSAPAEFVFVTPEGTSITEYQLLRLYERDTRREFRVMSTSMVNAKSGAENNLVSFDSEKIAPRTYVVRVTGLAPAEYGFLPPGMSGANMAAIGKIYTFTVQ
jgi:hypothetical protein